MELTILGCGPADPNPGGACSGYILDAGQGQLLLECGHGVVGKLQLYTALDRVTAVLISHMHPDHFFDLVPLKYARLRASLSPLPLYLPPEGEEVLMGIAHALREGPDFWTSAYELHTFDPEHGLDLVGFHILMAPTRHFIPAWAMTFEESAVPGHRFAYSSDTALSETVTALVHGADLFMVEASIKRQKQRVQEQGHLTPSEAGQMARAAGARRLLITHYPASRAEWIRKTAADAFGNDVELACEGAKFVV
jgi:ribonuclease BN (tRNA processing enzyme)